MIHAFIEEGLIIQFSRSKKTQKNYIRRVVILKKEYEKDKTLYYNIKLDVRRRKSFKDSYFCDIFFPRVDLI